MEIERPKILIYSSYSARKDHPDGVSNFIQEIKKPLEDLGAYVRIMAPHSKEKNGENNSIAQYELGRILKISHRNTTHESAVSFNKGLAKKLLLTIKPDIIDFHEPLAGHAAHTLLSGSPKRDDGHLVPCTIAHFHAHDEKLGWETKLSLLVLKALRRVDFNGGILPKGLTPGYVNTVMGELDGRIAISTATKDFWTEIYDGDYEVIYNGINTDELTLEGPIIESWKENGKKIILYAGRHDQRKGIPYLLKADQILLSSGINDIELKITGGGKETQKLKELARQMQLPNVEFLGNVPKGDLDKIYRTADVFVSPATGGEGFGRTLIEAESCGTIPIGSDIDGYREALGDFLFSRKTRPKDPEDIAKNIREVLSIPMEERRVLEFKASKHARENYSWNIIAKQTFDYYKRKLKDHGKPKKEEWPKKLKQEKIIFLFGRLRRAA